MSLAVNWLSSLNGIHGLSVGGARELFDNLGTGEVSGVGPEAQEG